ncbi:phosphoadenosine phosphosulfate reductase family protein [Candidatus Poriferisocius sp.]|uniref:phosphoadenosine phosphosulfate reductase domain-containing protein n=1 Tax=Candidatus Poriferisocius sp. TaxID=3101276 RepID=UPI003B01BE6A
MHGYLIEEARRRVEDIKAEHPDAIHVISVSGGKDSTAVYLLAKELLGADGFLAVTADTGHELPPTYDFIASLSGATGGPPVTTVRGDFAGDFPKRRENVKTKWAKEGIAQHIIDRALAHLEPSGNPYLDMCLLRGGFPSPKRQFCTEYLKILPIIEQFYLKLEKGRPIVSWTGVRRDESTARSHLDYRGPLIATREPNRLYGDKVSGFTFRPILEWNVADVWAWHKANGLLPNALYSANLSRVGCGPCIYARHGEIRLLAKHYPTMIDRIEDWERRVALVTKRDPPEATFFAAKHLRPVYGNHITTATHGIRAMVEYVRSRPPKPSENAGGLFPPEVEIFGQCGLAGMCE